MDSNRRKTILLISASYSPVVGGLQTVVRHVAHHELQAENRVFVITNRYPRRLPKSETISEILVERLQFLTPRFSDIGRGRPDLFLASCFYTPLVTRRLSKLVSELCPDVVNFHFPVPHITPYIIRLYREFQFRLVVSLHGDDIAGVMRLSPREREHFSTLLSQADALTTCSEYLKHRIYEIDVNAAAKTMVVYNGVSLDRFESDERFNVSRPYILSFGRLVRSKGSDLLINAFSQIADEFKYIDVIIAGDGPERDSLERQIESVSMTRRIHLIGTATPATIVHLLNGALFTVFPSRAEGFGITILEAMAAGRPVIATQVGGIPEFVEVPPNQLVEPTVENLADAMRLWLANDTDLGRIGEQNRVRARQFSWDHILARYHQVLVG